MWIFSVFLRVNKVKKYFYAVCHARSGFYPCLYYHPTINLAFPFHSITYVFLMQIIWNVCRRSGIIKGRSSCILDLNTFYVLGLLKNTKMHMFPPNNRPVYNESYQLMWASFSYQILFQAHLMNLESCVDTEYNIENGI
jgi:hypothetical protein